MNFLALPVPISPRYSEARLFCTAPLVWRLEIDGMTIGRLARLDLTHLGPDCHAIVAHDLITGDTMIEDANPSNDLDTLAAGVRNLLVNRAANPLDAANNTVAEFLEIPF